MIAMVLPSADEVDDDGDGYVECTHDASTWMGDSAIAGGDDCNDTDALTMFPNLPELCDGQINTCDGQLPTDEVDNDGDGYVECTIDDSGWDGEITVIGGDDCADTNDSVHTVLSYYLDSDGDGYGSPDFETIICEPPTDYILDILIVMIPMPQYFPNAPELCDGLDNTCSLQYLI